MLALTAFGGCATLPDITFVEDDASAAEGGADAGRDVLTEAASDSGSDASPPSCPDTRPTGGVCCGAVPCLGCTLANCTECTGQSCTTGEVCCLRGNRLDCRLADNCKQ